MRDELKERCNRIEECYEFMLAYAGQGLTGDEGGHTGGQLRHFLNRCNEALTGLADLLREIIGAEDLQPFDRYHTFMALVERDANAAQSVLQLVLCQPSISSQLIDNLNASIHIRTLLTDLFLIDEIIALHGVPKPAAS